MRRMPCALHPRKRRRAHHRRDRRVADRFPRRRSPRLPASTGRASRCSISTSTSACPIDASAPASGAICSIGSSIKLESAVITCWTAKRSRAGRTARRRRARRATRSISHSSASARTAISPSTILRPTSQPSDPYLVVTLDEACRRQQVGEGWFASIDDVPAQAISMSVRQILKSKEIIAVVPDARKAAAVKACVEGPVSPMAPASILQTHPNTTLYLDEDSAALLT